MVTLPGNARVASLALQSIAGAAGVSFMALGSIAVQTVDSPRLGGSEREPVLHGMLEHDKELLTALPCLDVEFLSLIELPLVRELSHEGLMLTSGTPQRHFGLSDNLLAEVQLPKVEQQFLNDRFVHQADLFALGFLHDG